MKFCQMSKQSIHFNMEISKMLAEIPCTPELLGDAIVLVARVGKYETALIHLRQELHLIPPGAGLQKKGVLPYPWKSSSHYKLPWLVFCTERNGVPNSDRFDPSYEGLIQPPFDLNPKNGTLLISCGERKTLVRTAMESLKRWYNYMSGCWKTLASCPPCISMDKEGQEEHI